jgi:hypothetical protein
VAAIAKGGSPPSKPLDSPANEHEHSAHSRNPRASVSDGGFDDGCTSD